MLRNNKEREEWLKRELDNKNNILLTDSGIKLIRVQINEGLFFNEIKVLSRRFSAIDKFKTEYVTSYCYCTDTEKIRSQEFEYVPTSEAQVIRYLKDFRNDDFVKGLSL